MNKILKKALSIAAAGALMLGMTDLSVFPEIDFGITASASETVIEEVSVEVIEALIETIPKYLEEYYTDVTVTQLKNVLDEYTAASDDLSSDELLEFYSSIDSSIKNLEYKTSDVPQIYISTFNENGNSIVKSTGYVDTSIAVVDTDGKLISDNSGLIKVRGNSTAGAEKKPYTIKFSVKENVLGMGKAKKWALLANCFDPTLMRNYIAFDFAQYMGLEYTSEKRYVELWIDGIFKGNYLMVEPVEIGKTRVNIETKEKNDFLIEFEKDRNESDVTYVESNGFRFIVSEPEEPSDSQMEYIQAILDNITSAIKSLNYEEIKKVVDIESFAKFYIFNEFYKTVDFGYSSVFYYYKDGLLYAGPAWDYDLSSGSANPLYSSNYLSSSKTDGLYASNKQLFYYLCQCESFLNEAKSYYSQYQDYIKNIYAEGGLIDTLICEYEDTFNRNFTDAGWDVSKAYSNLMRIPDFDFGENVKYLRNWFATRNKWLCEYWDIDCKLAGCSLSLNGNIGVNFYMALGDDVVNNKENYSMHFTLPNGKEIDVAVPENSTEVNGTKYYVFSCGVAAKEMTGTITAQMMKGKEPIGKGYKYSVKEYADTLIKNKDNNAEYAKAADMIKAMLNYGAYSQKYFDNAADNLANKGVEDKEVLNFTVEKIKDYENNKEQKGDFAAFAGSNLSLESLTTLHLYFKLNDEVNLSDLTFTCDEKTLEPSMNGEYVRVSITNISASKLNKDFTVTISNGTSSFDVTYNVMTYCYNVLSREETETRTPALKNLIKALCVYNQESNKYFK